MLHKIRAIPFLNSLVKQTAFDIPSIYEAVFKIPVGSIQNRLPQKSAQAHSPFQGLNRNQFLNKLPSKNAVDDFLPVTISRGMKFYLSIHDKANGYLRFTHGKMFAKVSDISTLRSRCFQKFPTGRCMEKQIFYQNSRSLRDSCLRKADLSAVFNTIVYTQ